jgi:hypothetical protein
VKEQSRNKSATIRYTLTLIFINVYSLSCSSHGFFVSDFVWIIVQTSSISDSRPTLL